MIKTFRTNNKIYNYIHHRLLADLVLKQGKNMPSRSHYLFLLKSNSLEHSLYLLKEGSGKREIPSACGKWN